MRKSRACLTSEMTSVAKKRCCSRTGGIHNTEAARRRHGWAVAGINRVLNIDTFEVAVRSYQSM